MEAAAGAVTRGGAFCPAAAATAFLRREPRCSRVSMRPRGGFTDEGHLRYYASPARCGGRGEEEEKRAVKRRAKLLKGLAALQAAAGGIGVAVAPGEIEERRTAIEEAADVLLAQLELLRAEEKEMKRKNKEEKKAAMREAAKQMKACDGSEDSEDEQEEMKRDNNNMEETNPTTAAASNQVVDCSTVCKDKTPKEMKRKEKKKKKKEEEKAAKKAKGIGKCDQSSSSSSSESSDSSDCEEEEEEGVVDMNTLRRTSAEVVPTNGVQTEAPKGDMNLPDVVSNMEEMGKGGGLVNLNLPDVVGNRGEEMEKGGLFLLNHVTECSDGLASGVGCSSAGSCCSGSKGGGAAVMVAQGAAAMENKIEKIEVCMGGKCRKSGAMELMQEFERKVGIEGVVVGCKCMGKCKEGPNVRVGSGSFEGDESVRAVRRSPLCMGVGLDDVGAIVANLFAEKKGMGFLAA